MTRITSLLTVGVTCLVAILIVMCWDGTGQRDTSHADRASESQSVSAEAVLDGSAATRLYPVNVRRPAGPPLVELAGVDPQGRAAAVACSTCHSVRQPNRENRSADTLDEFHQGLKFDHGMLACYSCHHPDQPDSLRLAEGVAVDYRDVMTLCSQCHAAQATAFEHGAHGGMNGHWDLSRGPQTKNNCVDCHDPHSPKYPKMIVGFKPRDRFLEGKSQHDDHE